MKGLKEYAAYIDHAVLVPHSTFVEIDKACADTIKYGYACMCVTPATLQRTVENLRGSNINISAAIGFPHGTTTTGVKAYEAIESIKLGANEIDMVMNIGMAKMGRWDYVINEIATVKAVISKENPNSLLKVIVETSLLTTDEKRAACNACLSAGADFIKTSTGFFGTGALIEDVAMFSSIANGKMKIKASGGIKTAETFLAMIDAGATRIGTIFSEQILKELFDMGAGN
ncbi:MAG: deoxyribose-phosphate aldolase [Clostridia bacterium]